MKSQTNTGYVAFLSLVAAIGGILFGYDTVSYTHLTLPTTERV